MARVSNKTIIEVWQRQEGGCAMCGSPLDEAAWENHHIRRVQDGGSDSSDNIVLLCDRDEHLYTHAGDFRKPYFYGKSGYKADDRQNFGDVKNANSSGAEKEQIEAKKESPEEIIEVEPDFEVPEEIDQARSVDAETDYETSQEGNEAESVEAKTEYETSEEANETESVEAGQGNERAEEMTGSKPAELNSASTIAEEIPQDDGLEAQDGQDSSEVAQGDQIDASSSTSSESNDYYSGYGY